MKRFLHKYEDDRPELDGDVARIPLTGRLGKGKSVTVDVSDLDLVRDYRWCVCKADSGKFYAVTTVYNPKRTILLHSLLHPEFNEIDHRDGDGLNNRRVNLREVTRSQNCQNRGLVRTSTTGFKGVNRLGDRFQCRIGLPSKKRLFLGYFDTAEQAALAYDAAARQHFGEFACLNFPKTGERGVRGSTTSDNVTPILE